MGRYAQLARAVWTAVGPDPLSPIKPLFFAGGLPILAIVIGAVAGAIASPAEADKPFYEIAAQVIPVLLLTLAVELRMFGLERPEALQRFTRMVRYVPRVEGSAENRMRTFEVWLSAFGDAREAVERYLAEMIFRVTALGFLVVGEFAALHPVAHGHGGVGNAALVYAALGAGLGGIAARALVETLLE